MSTSVLIPKPGEQKAEWEAYARQRNCYCSVWATQPSIYSERGLPPGFCGHCGRCGAMGHSRHCPGPFPYTGAWCDRCYRIESVTWLFRTPIGWIHLAVIVAVVALVGTFVVNLLKGLLG